MARAGQDEEHWEEEIKLLLDTERPEEGHGHSIEKRSHEVVEPGADHRGFERPFPRR